MSCRCVYTELQGISDMTREFFKKVHQVSFPLEKNEFPIKLGRTHRFACNKYVYTLPLLQENQALVKRIKDDIKNNCINAANFKFELV